jgi:hypothetical protein
MPMAQFSKWLPMTDNSGDGIDVPTASQAETTPHSGFDGFVWRLLFSAIILLAICNRHLAYEADELGKTAEVIALTRDGYWRNYSAAPDYYRKDVFSAFFFAASGFHSLTGLEPIESLNLFSVLCGAVFFSVLPGVLERVFGLSPWMSWLALVNAPILIIVFCYGNEVALALVATALAALALACGPAVGAMAAGILFAIAVFSRSDYLLLGFALGLLTIRREDGAIVWKNTLLRALLFYVTSLAAALAYLALVLHHLPRAPFEPIFNFKLMLGFLAYSPNPVIAALSIVGLVMCAVQRRWNFLLLLTALPQSIAYLPMLYSPKYLAPGFVVAVIFAVVAMQWIWTRSRLALIALLAVPWLVAITPFGVFGPSKSVLWYLPTDQGPVPTGGYLAFYAKLREGFYQRRYLDELREIGEARLLMDKSRGKADLVGVFNIQTLRLWSVEDHRTDTAPEVIPFWDPFLERDQPGWRKYMIRTSYLTDRKLTADGRQRVHDCFESGRVVSRTGNADPFPNVIEIGTNVPPAADSGLGRRILFFNEYWHGNQGVRRDQFFREWGAVSWIPRGRFDRQEARYPKPLYKDDAWVCFDEPVENAIYYSLRMPLVYTGFRSG